MINSGLLDSEGTIIPTAQNLEEVERTHPHDSDVEKFRRMPAHALVIAATYFYGRDPSFDEVDAFAGLLNKYRDCTGKS
jgi:hypothetical protein